VGIPLGMRILKEQRESQDLLGKSFRFCSYKKREGVPNSETVNSKLSTVNFLASPVASR